MASSLFSNPQPQRNPMQEKMQAAMAMLNGQNPQAIFQNLMQSNPQFQKFMQDNKGKSLDQIAQENGVDPNLLHRFIG